MKMNPMVIAAAVVALIVLTNKPKDQPAKPAPAPEVQPDTVGDVVTFKVNEDKAWQFMAYLVQEGRWLNTDDIVQTVDLMHAQQFLTDVSRIDEFRPKSQVISSANKASIIKVLLAGKQMQIPALEFQRGLEELQDENETTLLVGCKCNRNAKRAHRAARVASRVAASGWSFQSSVNGYAVVAPNGQVSGRVSASGPPTLMQLTPNGYVQHGSWLATPPAAETPKEKS